MSDLGDRLREALEKSGLSQSEVARRIGVRSQTINQWLSGAKAPSRDNLVKFVSATGANIGELLYGHRLRDEEHSANLHDLGMRGRVVSVVSLASVISRQVDENAIEKIVARFPCGPNSQAFILPDDSNSPEHPAGSVWIVDMDERPQPGDMVVGVAGESARPIFGRYRQEATASGRITIIAPLNGDWPAARSDIEQVEVIAVMTESTKPRRRF